ncbi:MAG: hypothetical protein IKY61_00320 [Thermoguttaceae bacterium]|nr:hypothetical protein [Thermoguttaceae bacterium]
MPFSAPRACAASSFPSSSFDAAPPADLTQPLKRNAVALERGRAWLRDADLLLVQTGGLVPYLGRGLHGHVATVARWGGDWFVLETRPGGGRALPLDAFLRRNRRRVDVFRPNPDGRWPEYRPEKCVAFLRRAVSARYGWRGVCSAALARLPFVRLLCFDDYFNDGDVAPQREFKPAFQNAIDVLTPTCERERLDEIWRFDRELQRRASLHCAEARALADRYAGVDSVPFLNDRFVEPADLARSPFYRYQFAFAPLTSKLA